MAEWCIFVALLLHTVLSQPDIEGRSRLHTSTQPSTEDSDVLGSSLLDSSARDVLGSSLLTSHFPNLIEEANESLLPLDQEDVLGSSLLMTNRSPSNADQDLTAPLQLITPDHGLTPADSTDPLGSSLLNSPNRQSLFTSYDEDTLGSSLICSPVSQSPTMAGRSVNEDNTLDMLGDSYLSDDEWLAEVIDSIRGPKSTSTPSKVRKELQFDRVKAKQKPEKPLSNFVYKEISSAKKMKVKAMNLENIRNTMKLKCLCGDNCINKVPFRSIRNLRQSYWSQSQTVRRHLLKLHVKKSVFKGKHRFIELEDKLSVCSKAFLNILRINKNSLTVAIKSCEKDNENTPGRCPRKMNANSLTAINWLEDYASFYGDRMPNSGDVKLPYKYRKLSVYESYRLEAEQPVSKSQFFKMWKTYFPQLKIKQVNFLCALLKKMNILCFHRYGWRARGQMNLVFSHMERRYYYGKRDFSRKCPLQSISLIIDGMDQAKTNLPHFAGRRSKCVNPADLLKTHITGVINHGLGGFHTYVDVNEYPHDPNLTINVLLKALKRAADRNENTLPPILYIQADNCGRENKNRYVLAFLELLVAENIFREIHLSFLYVGHTHEDVDVAFSKVSQQLKGVDVETIPELYDILPKPEPIGRVFDIKSWMQPYISNLEKISFPLHYKFEKYQDKVNIFYKGPHYMEWIRIEESILARRPPGEPKTVTPDYSKINIERNLKQIQQLQHLFKNENSVLFWNEFYKSIQDNRRMIPESTWILDELPRQGDIPAQAESVVPEHIRDIVNKEITVPQVVVKRKKVTSQSKQQNTNRKQSFTRKKRGSANDPKQRKPNALFIDIAENRSVLDRVKLCYIFDEIFNDEESKTLVNDSQSETQKYFPQLSRWISDFLSRNTEMTASNIGNNILIKQVLRLVHSLVSFGFYGKYEDIKRLLDPLMSLLDGRHDKPYPNIEGKDAHDVLVAFRQSERFKPCPETKAIVEAKVQALEVLDLFFNFRFNNRLEKFIYLFKITHQQMNKPGGYSELAPLMNESFELEQFTGLAKKGKKKMAEIFESTAFMKQYNIADILLDLSHYEYGDILRKSMHLLNRWFSAYQNLFKRAVLTQVLITDDSVKVYRRAEQLLPELRRLSANRMGDTEANQVNTILKELLSFCHLSDEEEEPHPINQTVLYNMGIIECMVTFLSKEIDVKILDHYEGLIKVFENSFVLLKLLARSNQVVQLRLYDRLDLILAKRGGFRQMAELVTEIFTGNTKTCMKITEQQVQKVMSLIVVHREKVPQFVGILKTVIKVDELDLPLKRNQIMVMTNFMQHSSDVAPAIHEDENARMKLLTSSDTHKLEFFISVVDLLATCAEGENRYIESICQTILKIPELFKVLNNPDISNSVKRPYLAFFLGSYLNTVSGMIESGAGEIPHDTVTWDYLTNVSSTIVTVTIYVRTNSDLVRQLLKKQPTKGSSKGNEKEEMRGSLHYLFDAVMPFLQVFCTSYYEMDQENYPDEPVKMKAVAESFKAFFEEIVPLVTIEKQLEKLITCMSLLFSTNALSSEDMETFQQKYGHGAGAHDVRSDARKNYEECYGGEEDISAQLSVFALNMKIAYGGVNDVQTQIGFPSKLSYSEIGGDEELPLSEEFQAHINVFIDHSARTPIEKYRLSEKLIRQLSVSTKLEMLPEREMIEQVELDLKCMQLLRGMVHNEIVKLPEHNEYNTQSCKRQLKVIRDVQNALNHYGSIAGTLDHLGRANDDVVRELLAFLVALLYNSNFAVQTTLYEFFSSAKEETFVHAIKIRINMSIIATRERRVLQALRQAKIDETLAQVKALKKAMKNGSLADMALSSLSRTIRNSVSSMRKSVSTLPGSRGRRRASMTGQQSSVIDSALYLGVKDESHVPNGRIDKSGTSDLTQQTLKTSKQNEWGPSRTKYNKVAPDARDLYVENTVPAIQLEVAVPKRSAEVTTTEINVEITVDDELEDLLNAEMPEFEFKDDGCIELVLRLLGSMCDSQHTGLQNYLREQSTNIKSIDVVAETINYLNIMYTNISAESIALITEIFEMLVEFTSGNSTNQAVVFDNKICDYINHILRADVFKDCTDSQVYTLKAAIGHLVRCLTEENFSAEDGLKANLPKEVMEFLDTSVLVSVMTDARKLYEPKKEEDFKTLLHIVGFQYYHLLARKLDLYPDLDMDGILKTDEQRAAFSFYADNTVSIEIVKNGILQKLYFQVRDKGVLREEIKEKFKYGVDRSSPSNKIRDFMEWVRDIIKDIKYQRLVRANPVGRFLVKAWSALNYLTMLITLVICVFVMVSWEEGDSNSPRYRPSFRFAYADIVIYALGGIHNCLSLGIVFSYTISNKPTFPSLEDIVERWRGTEDSNDEDESWIDTKKESHLEVKAFGFKTIYYLLFLGCSIAGTFTRGYFFAFHLLHIAELNQLLKRLIQAVTTNGKSLMMVTLLGLAILYIYSLILFAFYRGWMWSPDDGRHCRTIYECFISVLHHGLILGPYEHFKEQMGSDFPQAIGITFFDVSFFVIITVIGLNIVLGIIVDTFSQLRDAKMEIEKDMKSTCLICSRESYDFEKKGGGEEFQRHVKLEHNQWAYLFFFIHLDETRPNDYSTLEFYVYKLMMMKNFDFFPLGRALSLENEEDSKDQKLDQLQLQVNFVVAKLKEQETDMLKEKEKQKQQEWERTHKKLQEKKHQL